MSTYPKLSVLLPVHNGDTYLYSAIESVLCQTYSDFELIVINDRSTDNSGAIAESFKEYDDRVKVLNCNGTGLIDALNEGIVHCHGIYIARMDADDISHPKRFEKQVEFLDTHPLVGIVGTNVRLINANGSAIGQYSYFMKDKHLRIAIKENCGSLFAHPAVMIRANLFTDNGLRYERYVHAEDYALWLKMSSRCRMHNLQEQLLDYRIHAASISRSKNREQNDSRAMAREEILGTRAQVGNPLERTLLSFLRFKLRLSRFLHLRTWRNH